MTTESLVLELKDLKANKQYNSMNTIREQRQRYIIVTIKPTLLKPLKATKGPKACSEVKGCKVEVVCNYIELACAGHAAVRR